MTSKGDKAYMPQSSTANLPHDVVVKMPHALTMEPIDYLILRVAERLAAVDKSERQVSLEATGTPDALRYIRARRAMPSPIRLASIAETLGTSEDFLLGRSDDPKRASSPLRPVDLLSDPNEIAAYLMKSSDERAKKNKQLRDRSVELPDDIQVYPADPTFQGLFFGDEQDWHNAEGFIITFGISVAGFQRQAKLFSDDSTYGFYMPGVSMYPAFESGAPVIASKKRSALPGDYVVAYINDDPEELPHFAFRGMLKRLISVSAEYYEFEEFQPAKRFKVKRDQILMVDRVYTLRDLLT